MIQVPETAWQVEEAEAVLVAGKILTFQHWGQVFVPCNTKAPNDAWIRFGLFLQRTTQQKPLQLISLEKTHLLQSGAARVSSTIRTYFTSATATCCDRPFRSRIRPATPRKESTALSHIVKLAVIVYIL